MAKHAGPNQDWIEGRHGLRIPPPEWYEGYGATNLVDFFRKLWIINGDSPRDFRYVNVNLRFIRNFFGDGRELVLPPIADKPLLVIRGSFTPNKIKSKELGITALSNTFGVEQHSILTLPSDPDKLQFEEVVGVKTGSAFDSTQVSHHGVVIHVDDFEPDPNSTPEMSRDEADNLTDERYSAAIHEILDETVELLT